MEKDKIVSGFFNNYKIVILLMVTISLLLSIAIYFVFFRTGDLPEVDMNDVVKKNEIAQSEDSTIYLRVAVGAMISPEITFEYYQELMNLIANKIGMKVKFFQHRTYEEVNDLVKNRLVDVAYVCSGAYTMGFEDFGMEILAVPVVSGRKTYNCYIISNSESGIESFQDLKGKRFAFTDPNSNTGYLVPIYMLAKIGETPDSFFKETFFTYSHDNSIKSIADKQSDGAAVDGMIWDFFNSLSPLMVSRTKIIERSPPYGIPPIVVHPEMDKRFKKKLRKIFLSLHLDEKSKFLLDQIHIDRFEAGEPSMYDTIIEMRNWIKEMKTKK
ncbi:MAG: phosphate/phosphite/phosphonate ABC transporter substrate-binding protein [Candidatus Aminicenantes bacterium]|nr:phosphate/phosphite/phosphonate ABC transporter substrate-binding protein [Candidatus Aminicenantes bacterium]